MSAPQPPHATTDPSKRRLIVALLAAALLVSIGFNVFQAFRPAGSSPAERRFKSPEEAATFYVKSLGSGDSALAAQAYGSTAIAAHADVEKQLSRHRYWTNQGYGLLLPIKGDASRRVWAGQFASHGMRLATAHTARLAIKDVEPNGQATGSPEEIMKRFDGSVFEGKIENPNVKVFETLPSELEEIGKQTCEIYGADKCQAMIVHTRTSAQDGWFLPLTAARYDKYWVLIPGSFLTQGFSFQSNDLTPYSAEEFEATIKEFKEQGLKIR